MLASNDGFQLVCQPPAGTRGLRRRLHDRGGGQCATESLCVTSPDSAQPFCSMLCRNDDDCPVGSASAQPARCLDYQTKEALTDGSHAIVGMCIPADKIAGDNLRCARRTATRNEGCVFYAGRTSLRVCRRDRRHQVDGRGLHEQRRVPQRRVLRPQRHPERRAPTGRSARAPAIKSSDCGADQRCVRLVVSNNGTPDDPLDDLVSGYCQTLFPAVPGEDCQSDAHCMARQDGSDTCDVPHGLCYKKTAVPGSACARDSECMLGGVCSMGPRFAGGYCQTFGCDPAATTGVDACAGARSVCATRGGPDEPIGACYEGCQRSTTAPCSRAAAQYRCESATTGQPATICLVHPPGRRRAASTVGDRRLGAARR